MLKTLYTLFLSKAYVIMFDRVKTQMTGFDRITLLWKAWNVNWPVTSVSWNTKKPTIFSHFFQNTQNAPYLWRCLTANYTWVEKSRFFSFLTNIILEPSFQNLLKMCNFFLPQDFSLKHLLRKISYCNWIFFLFIYYM